MKTRKIIVQIECPDNDINEQALYNTLDGVLGHRMSYFYNIHGTHSDAAVRDCLIRFSSIDRKLTEIHDEKRKEIDNGRFML